jgi:hypothetical protein
VIATLAQARSDTSEVIATGRFTTASHRWTPTDRRMPQDSGPPSF